MRSVLCPFHNFASFSSPVEEHRRELAAIVYVGAEAARLPTYERLVDLFQETNILGFKGPRKMTIIIPGMSSDHHRVEVRPKSVRSHNEMTAVHTSIVRSFVV